METGLETAYLYPVAITDPQTIHNRRIAQQFATDATTLPPADDVILQDFAQDRIVRGEVVALLDAFFIQGFADAQVNMRTVIADESVAMFEFVFCGRHVALFWGLPATHRVVELPIVIACHLTNSQIRRAALYYDAGVLLRQLGLAL